MHMQPVFFSDETRVLSAEREGEGRVSRKDAPDKWSSNLTGQAKAQDRGKRTEGRGQRSEDGRRRQRTEVRGQRTEGGRQRKHSAFSIQNYPARVVGGEVAEDFFNRGLCLPSGTAMSNGDLDRIIETIKNVSRKGAKPQRKT